ncbi:COG3014 family protein [Psychromonas sp. 14N.309.X.WAT.B.A12]|jgi:uncharacterized protein|uniref:COG3014 family protein n=3 Tax=Psychromonas TaxID=67572 RepID=UPI0025B073F4|nr:hypothetical protein [Psychromonas sp. 14N.309.X.WAT.B.A12]MDN2661927.1 hypothetical protein [Psychromonas sp. 14N.309.X.WAT.B.A12]
MHKLLLAFVFLLSGCAQHNNNRLADDLQFETPESILSALQETKPDDRDIAQYYLNLGYLQLLSGQFPASIESLLIAKKQMQSLAATSVSENIGAGTVNETLRSYSGYPLDRVMVHNMLALSYLFNRDIDGARVEMLQADVAMKKLADKDSLSGQLVSTHLLSGIIYELLDERSDAFISYQLAENILNQRKIALPEGLTLGLLRMSLKMGNDQAYDRYSKSYPNLVKKMKGKEQVFVLYFDGVVSNKIQASLTVPSFNGQQLIRIAMPTYPERLPRSLHAKISDGEQLVSSDVAENINVIAREDLDKEYPSILLLTTTRAIAKYQVVQETKKKDQLLGTLLNFATLLSEVADLRSWNMLPATIQFAYLETNADDIVVSTPKTVQTDVDLSLGHQHVILVTNLSDKVWHYQQ